MTSDPRLWLIGRAPGRPGESLPTARTDWVDADPNKIARALDRALAKPTGGWVVVGASRALREGPQKVVLDGREWVAYHCARGPRVAPEACPHMGAELSKGFVDAQGRIVCPWHGLALDGPRGTWRPLPSFDDGVLVWARLESLTSDVDPPTERPFVTERPKAHLDAVIRMEADCETRDVLANRLDPWHGAHFHPHSFARLRVVGEDEESITVRVVYRILGRVGMEVDARFHCPDARTIVMTIVAGEGVGSVVETHATPMGAHRTAIIEATLATSDRLSVISWMPRAGFLRPFVEARAKKLWVEDADYCERLYALRTKR